MAERMLICKVKRTDQTRVELYGKHHKWPDMKCDVADLAAVLDVAALPIGEERAVMCWAVYELSEKKNAKGNAYKDVLLVEPIGGPATVTSSAVGDPALLGELRAIRALLELIVVKGQGFELPTVPTDQEQDPEPDPANGHNGNGHGNELDQHFPRFADGTAVPEGKAGEFYARYLAAVGQAPENIAELRKWAVAHP